MIHPLTYYDTSGLLAGRRLYYKRRNFTVDGIDFLEYMPLKFGHITKSGLYVVYHDYRIRGNSRHPFLRGSVGWNWIEFNDSLLNHKQGAVYRSSLPKWMLFTDMTEDERKTRVII
jgi:hypothetical protein